MTWDKMRPWLGTVVRLALGVVWIWSSLAKLHSPRTFVQAVRAYEATPEWLSKAIGYGLPVLEFCLGVLLIVGVAVRLAAALSAVLFVVFLIGIISVAARGISIDCGCFGGGGLTTNTNYTWDILRDIGLLILAAYLVMWSFTRISIEEWMTRGDYVPPPSAKRMRSEQGRRKYNAMLEARRREARSRAMYVNASIAGVVVLIALIGIGVQAGRAKIQGSIAAANATPTDGVVFGKAAAAKVDIYEDFQCPNCLRFEKAVGGTIDADVRANKAQVKFHIMAFLDSSSNGNRYSSRAANAALCASDVSVDTFVAYHNVLYGEVNGAQVQPAEGTNGRTDANLISYASQAGIKGSALGTFSTCVSTEQHKALVQAMTDAASKQGVNGTPTIKVNGKSISPTLAAWKKAVSAALAKGPAPDPSKTPTPSPSKSPSGSSSAVPTKSASVSKPASGSPTASPTQ